MTFPNVTDAGTAGPEIDDEPLLVRPYVRLLEQQQAADEPLDDAPSSAGQPEDDGRQATALADIRLTRAGAAPVPPAPPVARTRRRFLAVGSGMLMLALGATVLALGLGDRPAAPAPGAAGTTAPGDGPFRTAAVPAPPASPATAGASPVSPAPSLPGVSLNPSDDAPPSDSSVLNGPPAVSPPPGDESRTGRIIGVSGLCLDGNAGTDGEGDRIRRWDCNGTSGQAWTVADDGTIQTLGRCLQASSDQLRLRNCDGGPAQQWRSGPAGSLINQASGLCLGSSGDVDSRGPQRMAACNQSDAQRWTLP